MKTIKKLLGYIGLTIFCFVILYGLAYLILPKISYNNELLGLKENEKVTIYISNNGTHSDIIVPYINDQKDWSEIFSTNDTPSKDTNVNYLKIGWGDSKIYFETPTWNDLTLSNAFKAMIGSNESVLRVDFIKSVFENDRCISISINASQYQKLVAYITKSIRNTEPIQNEAISNVYGSHCAFYKANGRLSLLKVCNTWVNKGLYEAGLPAVHWTISCEPILELYKNLK